MDFKAVKRFPKSFSQIRKTVLTAINLFLQEIETSSLEYDLRVNYSKGKPVVRLTSFLIEIGVVKILEASNYQTKNIVSLSLVQ